MLCPPLLVPAAGSVNVARTVLLQGKAGRVLSVAVLMANPDFPHLSDQFGLLAIATETMTSVIALEPKLAMAYRLPREEDARPGVLPCLCWRSLQARDEVVGKTSNETSEREKLLVRHPVLVTARGSTISYVQVMPFERHEIAEQRPDVPLKFNHVGMLSVEGEVGGIEWLGGQVLAAVTKDERIHVIDPFELNAQLDTVSVPYLQLVYHKHFPNPETQQPEYGADCSIRASDNSLLLLGNGSVVVVKVMTWSDRVDALIAAGQWIDALALALDFYDGQAKAAIGLPRDPRQLRNRLRDQVVDYVVQYVTAALLPSSHPNGRVDRVQLRVIGGCAMEYSMTIGRMDLIFTDIYAKFASLGATDVLCELLEPYILNDYMDAMVGHMLTHSSTHQHTEPQTGSDMPARKSNVQHRHTVRLKIGGGSARERGGVKRPWRCSFVLPGPASTMATTGTPTTCGQYTDAETREVYEGFRLGAVWEQSLLYTTYERAWAWRCWFP